ncbi:MAG TPA: GGDEF domain-containing protein [Dehalococcoidia bacterium]|nr:GGDEF domain-containing protein [Dehalococcoidia bacterium]
MARVFRLRLLILAGGACAGLAIAAATFAAETFVGMSAAVATLLVAALATFAAGGWLAALRAHGRMREAERDLTRARDAATAAALRDPLTGLGNYRLFEALLRFCVARTQRYGHPLSVLLIEVNVAGETHGGDRVAAQERLLRFIGAVLSANLRDADFTARLSETMFGVILSDTEVENAQHVRERLRAVALSHWPAGDTSWVLAGGVAGYTPDCGRVEDLLAEANRRLALERRRTRADSEP